MNKKTKSKLSELQQAHAVLTQTKRALKENNKRVADTMTLINAGLRIVGAEIESIKSTDEELITDHAVVRYLQRYTDVDIEKVKASIRKLPDASKVVINKNVITVGDMVNTPREKP